MSVQPQAWSLLIRLYCGIDGDFYVCHNLGNLMFSSNEIHEISIYLIIETLFTACL